MNEIELRNTLVEQHEACFGWATVCCRGDADLAADVLHSVYVSVLEGRAKFQEKSEFRTWLFGVIRNVARDMRRGRWWSRMVRLDFELLWDSIDPRTASEIEEREESRIINQALQHLPARQREVIHLVFFEKLTLAAAAEVMNVSTGTASQHYARGKATLKQKLEPLWTARVKQGTRSY